MPVRNRLQGASRKTVLNILSTLSAMLTTANDWHYSAQQVELKKLVLPDRNSFVAPHFTLSEVQAILTLAQEPWRTFFILLALTALRAGEALGGGTLILSIARSTSAALRGTEKCNPQRAKKARQPSYSPMRWRWF
jgi:integrase